MWVDGRGLIIASCVCSGCAVDTFNSISFHFQLRFLLHCSWHAGKWKATHAHTCTTHTLRTHWHTHGLAQAWQQLKLTAQKYKPNQMHIFQIHWICSATCSALSLSPSFYLSLICALPFLHIPFFSCSLFVVSFYRYKHFAFMLYSLVFSPCIFLASVDDVNSDADSSSDCGCNCAALANLIGNEVCTPLCTACVCVLVCVCIECSAQDYFANNRNKLNLWNEFHYETASRCEIGNSNWSLSNNQHQIHNERTTDRER